MDFLEQDVDVFGDDYNNNNHDDGREFSSSSSSSSSSTSSSSNGSDGGDTSSASGSASSGGEEENGEEVGSVKNNYDYNDNIEGGIFGYEEEEEERDLFGSDNEDCCKTLGTSPFCVLPVIRITDNPVRGGFGRGRW